MNVMEINKLVGAFCGALLVFLLIKWGVETTYHSHEEKIDVAYLIEVEEVINDDEAEIEKIPFVELVSLADVDKGKKVFSKCKSCHKIDEKINGTGPYLYGIVGRPIASLDDYTYSNILVEMKDKVWNEDELNGFLTKPSKYAPGTKMSYSGLSAEKDRANLVAYLKTFYE